MDADENLRTLKELSKLAAKTEFSTPSDHLRTIAKRLAYLFEKRSTIHKTVKPPYFQDDEIDALFWLTAFHYVWTGRDVRPYFKRVKGHELIDFARFDRMVDYVIAAKAKEDIGPSGAAT